MIKIAPSMLSADFARLGEQIEEISRAGADYIHVDVMDGHFVPNISFGASVMKSLNGIESAPYDVHLMIEDPDKYLEDFVTDRTEYITVHQEACPHLNRTIQHLHSCGVKAGVALNPGSPVCLLDEVLDEADMILIMSVNPGFGGQSLIPSTLRKIRKLADLREKEGYKWTLEIDGGVNLNTISDVSASGVDIFVAGSAVFKADSLGGRVKELKAAAEAER
ncbi:ribulose-phosphate 3-epimerase [Eubacterium sp. F2]|jgi:ribulose-phosphate 3-epimerase|uniref:ribulose-phosphate 3-epimerase n=1 Tax=Eubacterium sp. F2 TaxID=3381348 RepID=UPI0039082364